MSEGEGEHGNFKANACIQPTAASAHPGTIFCAKLYVNQSVIPAMRTVGIRTARA